MKPPPFRYHRPGTVPEALAELDEVATDAAAVRSARCVSPFFESAARSRAV